MEELGLLVEEFRLVRSTEEEVFRTQLERRRKWGPFAVVANVLGGIRWRGKKRRGRGKRVKATMDQRAASLWDQFSGWISVTSDS